MQTDFRIRDRDRLLVLSRRAMVRLADIGAEIGAALADVYGYVGPTGTATGEPFVIYHGTPTEDDRPFEIEICAPVAHAVAALHGWELMELPAGTFASVMHVGSYDSLGTAYDALEAWIAREGHAFAGPPREVYLSEPGSDPGATRTVIEFPVAPSTDGVPVVST